MSVTKHYIFGLTLTRSAKVWLLHDYYEEHLWPPRKLRISEQNNFYNKEKGNRVIMQATPIQRLFRFENFPPIPTLFAAGKTV